MLRLLRLMARFSAVSLALFVVLLVSAYLLAYFFSDSLLNRYKRYLEKTYNVAITFHHSHLDGLTLSLDGLEIDSRGGVPLARVDRAVAPLHLLDFLFHGSNRIVGDIRLVKPRVDLVISPDGHFNWETVTLNQPRLHKPIDENYRGKIRVEDGFVSLRDRRKGDYLGQFDKVQGTLDVKPDHGWALRAEAEDKTLQVRGSAELDQPVELHIGWKRLALDDWLRHPALLPYARFDQAITTGQVKLTFRPEHLENTLAMGELELGAGEVALPGFAEKATQASGSFRLLGSTLVVEVAHFKWRGQPVKVTGQLRPGGGSLLEPYVKLRVQGGPVPVQDLRKAFPQLPIQGNGKVQIDVLVEGPWREPSIAGRVQGTKVKLAGQQIRDFLGDFELDRNSLHLQNVLAHTETGEPLEASGYIFLDKQRQLVLSLHGSGLNLSSVSPWLAGADGFSALALGSAANPVLTGRGSLVSLPANAFGLQSGQSHFWLDPQSALLWDGSLWGSGGQVQVPWAVVDYHQGDVAAGVATNGYSVSMGGAQARVEGVASVVGNYASNQFAAEGTLWNSTIQAPGLPPLEDARGHVAYQNGQLLIPEVQGNIRGDSVAITGLYANGGGQFFVDARDVNAQNWVASAPAGSRDVLAAATLQGRDVTSFKAVTQGAGGDAWAVGRYLAGRGPEFYAEFVDARLNPQVPPLSGQLATYSQNGRLQYYYAVRPEGSGPDNLLLGQGYMMGTRVVLNDNFLQLPTSAEASQHSIHGEGRAYSYFGPTEGPPLTQVETPPEPWQLGGTLSARGSYDLRGGGGNVEVRGRNLNTAQVMTWFGPLAQIPLPAGLKLEESLVDVDAHLAGSPSKPQVSASLRSPWTRLSREMEDGRESLAFSWRADARGSLKQPSGIGVHAIVSPRPQDAELLYPPVGDSPDWLRADLTVRPDLGLSGVIRTEAFPLTMGRFLTPAWLGAQLPSGVLSTEGLQISGTLQDPQLFGRIALRNGRYWTGYRYLPIEEAFADFASEKEATALTRFRLRSGGLTLEGRGNRTRDGRMIGQIWADDLPLDTLNDFGFPTLGWKGTVDLAGTFRDSRGMNPEAWLAIEGRDLVPSQDGIFGVRRLVLGQLERELDGIPTTGPGKGVHFRMEAGEMIVELPASTQVVFANPQESEVAASGRVSWRAFPQPRQTALQWLTSANGPRFGAGAQPLQIRLQKFAWELARQLLGGEPTTRQGYVSGELRLLGQWFEQHRVANPKLTGQPLLALDLTELLVEGPGAVWSGLRLRDPLRAAYEVRGNASGEAAQHVGWLHLDPTVFEFFHRPATPQPAAAQTTEVVQRGETVVAPTPMPSPSPVLGEPVVGGTLEASVDTVVTENPGLKKGATRLSGQQLRLALNALPVQNLAFLVPRFKQLGGTLEKVELEEQGALTQPQAQLTVAAQNLRIDGLNITAVQGSAALESTNPGQVRLVMGEGEAEPRLLLGAENDLAQSLLMEGSALLDFDRLLQVRGQTLSPVWQGWTLTDRTAFDLKAQLSDSQMRLLSAIAPERSRLGGRLSGSLALTGTGANPELAGELAIENGSLEHPSLRTPITGLNLQTRFERVSISDAEPSQVLSRLNQSYVNRYTLEKLEGYLGGQPFRGSGKAELAGLVPTFLDVSLDGDELPIQWEGLLDGRATVHLNLHGIPARRTMGEEVALIPELTGDITVPSATLQLPDQKTMDVLRTLSASQGYGIPLSYNVGLHLGDDVWLNALGSSVRATGDLTVTPSGTGNRPGLAGQVFLSRGVLRVPIYELTFRLRQGYAVFEDSLMPRLQDVEADASLGNYLITVRVEGVYPDLRVSMISNPPLPESDLRRLTGLDTSTPAGLSSPFSATTDLNQGLGNNFIVNQGVSYLSNLLTSPITGEIGRLLFNSDISFDVLPTSGYTIRLAKSLDENDRFLLTFAQVIGTTQANQSTSQYGLEWRFAPNLLTRFSLDNYGVARIWFQGLFRY